MKSSLQEKPVGEKGGKRIKVMNRKGVTVSYAHVRGRASGVGGVGDLNLKNAINMVTTEQRFTQIRAERKKRSKNQEQEQQ